MLRELTCPRMWMELLAVGAFVGMLIVVTP